MRSNYILLAFVLLFGAAWALPPPAADSVRIESIGDLLLPVQPVAVTMPTDMQLLAHTDGTVTASVSLTLGTPVTDSGGHAMAYEPSTADSLDEISNLDVLYTTGVNVSKRHRTIVYRTSNPPVTDLVYC